MAYQHELYHKLILRKPDDWTYIGSGGFASVHGHKNREWVLKRAQNDGTRTYLEWCLIKQARGERMQGMPEIDFVIPISEHQYVAAMRRYYPSKDAGPIPDYIYELAQECELDNPAIVCRDLHRGNIMMKYSDNQGEFILTDPSSSGYRPVGCRYTPWNVPRANMRDFPDPSITSAYLARAESAEFQLAMQ